MKIDIRLIIKLPAIIEKGINKKSTSDKLIFYFKILLAYNSK